MGSRYMKPNRKEKLYDVGMDTFIERLKKVRALSCSPSDIGIDNYLWKRLSLNRSNTGTKFL